MKARAGSARSVFRRGLFGEAGLPVFEGGVEQWEDEQRQDRSCKDAAGDDHGKRARRLRADALGKDHRQGGLG